MVIADADLRALTLEGMQARARAAVADALGDGLEGDAEAIASCALDDLLGRRTVPEPSGEEKAERLSAYEVFKATEVYQTSIHGNFRKLLTAGHWPELVGHEHEFANIA